jgi:hypothetical protein
MFPTAGSTINWQNRNSVFCDKFATILQHLWNVSATCWCVLQLCRVASPVGRSNGFCLVASFATCWLVSAYCGLFAVCRGHEFNTSKVEYGRDVSVNIVHLLSVDRTQKPLLFFSFSYFWCCRPQPSSSFSLNRHMMYSLQLSAECEHDRTMKHQENVCVVSDVCVCVRTVISFLFLFCLCQYSVDPP